MRSLATVAAGIAATIVLTGCGAEGAGEAPAPKSDTSATPEAEASFDIEAVLRNADPAPYSAHVKAEVYVASTLVFVLVGRLNFNTSEPTGRFTLISSDAVPEDEAVRAEAILLEDATYMRMLDDEGTATEWQRVEMASAGMGATDYGVYAELLLDLGEEARMGPEEVDGVPAYRLSGQLTRDQIRTVDRGLYDLMRAMDTEEFDCDVWVDESGRVVRLEQWLRVSGQSGHNIVRLGKFSDSVPVSAPE